MALTLLSQTTDFDPRDAVSSLTSTRHAPGPIPVFATSGSYPHVNTSRFIGSSSTTFPFASPPFGKMIRSSPPARGSNRDPAGVGDPGMYVIQASSLSCSLRNLHTVSGSALIVTLTETLALPVDML